MIDDKIIGFIGAGNMGSAMIGGIFKGFAGCDRTTDRKCALTGDAGAELRAF